MKAGQVKSPCLRQPLDQVLHVSASLSPASNNQALETCLSNQLLQAPLQGSNPFQALLSTYECDRYTG